MNFNYYLPVNLIFGRGKAELIGTEAAKYGKKALIVTGHSSTKESGLLDRAVKLLADAGLESAIYDNVSQNPLTTTAIEGADFAKSEGCDVVIALGGGSIMDCAKAIAFIVKNDGDINDYIFNRKHSDEALPLILVPTTCGTGSEGNGFAVLTNPDTGDKKSLRCPAIVGKASIIDSELMETMPKSILASVGFDALCHCMEAYTSKIGQPITDMLAHEGMALIGEHLVKVYKGEGTADDWDAITWASTIGGMVINTAGVTLAHGMEHPASGLKNIVHGRGLAALTPIITGMSVGGAPEKFAEISRCLGGTDEKDCAERINTLLSQIDLKITLGEQGIKEEDVDWMVDNFFKVSIGNYNNHPVTFTREQIKEIYLKAL